MTDNNNEHMARVSREAEAAAARAAENAEALRGFYGLTAIEDADITAAAEVLNHCAQTAQQGGHVALAALLNRFTATVLWEADARRLFLHPTPDNVQDVLDEIERLN